MKKLFGIVLLTAAACTLAVSSRAADTAQQKGKRVVDEALAALGGDAFLHMQNRLEAGRAYSFYNQQLSGLSIAHIYTQYLPLPKPPVPGKLQVREREAFGKEEDSGYILLTEDAAWEVTFRGARPFDAQRFANYKDSTLHNVFYILRQRLGEPDLSFYSQGTDIYQNRPVNIVDITDADNVTVTVYFDQGTKLPTRQIYKRRNPEYHDFDTEVSEFAKFRDVGGGVMWPYDIRRERNGQKIYEMYSDSVEINKDLKDSLFALSDTVKVLKK